MAVSILLSSLAVRSKAIRLWDSPGRHPSLHSVATKIAKARFSRCPTRQTFEEPEVGIFRIVRAFPCVISVPLLYTESDLESAHKGMYDDPRIEGSTERHSS